MCKRSCQDPVTESGTEHNSSSPMYVMRSSFDFCMQCHFSHGRRLCASHWNETVPLFQMLLTVYSGMIFLNFSFPCCFWYPRFTQLCNETTVLEAELWIRKEEKLCWATIFTRTNTVVQLENKKTNFMYNVIAHGSFLIC